MLIHFRNQLISNYLSESQTSRFSVGAFQLNTEHECFPSGCITGRVPMRMGANVVDVTVLDNCMFYHRIFKLKNKRFVHLFFLLLFFFFYFFRWKPMLILFHYIFFHFALYFSPSLSLCNVCVQQQWIWKILIISFIQWKFFILFFFFCNTTPPPRR